MSGIHTWIEKLIDQEASVYYTSSSGKTALWHAVHGRHDKCVEILIEAGSDLDRVYTDGSLLSWAAENGYHEGVLMLLRAGADPNNPARRLNPLWMAVQGNQEKCVKSLIEHRADVEAKYYGITPLMLAAKECRVGCMKALLTAGADVNFKDRERQTVLWRAADTKCADSIKLLLEAVASVNAVNRYAKDAVIRVLEAGIRRTTENTDLDVMEDEKKCNSCLKVLLEHGASVNGDRADTPLMLSAGKEYMSCLQTLLQASADVNLQNFRGETALMSAAESKSIKCIQLLLEAGADVNSVCKDGKNALIKVLQPRPYFYRRVPLETDEICGSCLKLLLEHKADVKVVVKGGDDAGLTPLIRSADNGYVNCTRILLTAGAHVNMTLRRNGFNAAETHLSRTGEKDKALLKLLFAAGETSSSYDLKSLVFEKPSKDNNDHDDAHEKGEEEPDINLMATCREVIRSHIAGINPHQNMFVAVKQLGLPDIMQSYLLYGATLEEEEN